MCLVMLHSISQFTLSVSAWLANKCVPIYVKGQLIKNLPSGHRSTQTLDQTTEVIGDSYCIQDVYERQNSVTGVQSVERNRQLIDWRLVQPRRLMTYGTADVHRIQSVLTSLASSSLHFAWVEDYEKCIVVTRDFVCVCLCVCLSVRGHMPIVLQGPGCNFGQW